MICCTIQRKSIAVLITAAWLVLGGELHTIWADGGTVRFSERRGNHTITVFTDPTPLRAGLADVSVMVQDAESSRPQPETPIVVRAYPISDRQSVVSAAATREAATNKLLQAAPLKFHTAGTWRVEVSMPEIAASSPLAFDLEVLEPLPHWLDLAGWIAWPFLAIGLFGIHQRLNYRRQSRAVAAK